MNRTTNTELLKVAMNYLPNYDLSVKKMGEDYLSCNYGDFLLRFLYRMAYESGIRIERMPLEEVVDQLQEVMSGLASEIHDMIDKKKDDTLGVLSPSCAFLHKMVDNMELVKMQFNVLYPLLAYHRRNDAVAFDECEHLKLLSCYPNATSEDLFRMSKIAMHTSCGDELRDVYIGILMDFVRLYKELDFQTSMEYADFAEEMGRLREESDKDLYDKSQNLWMYKVCRALGCDEPEENFKLHLDKFRAMFGQRHEGHIMYVVDLFLHSNTGMMDSKFGVQAIQCLDYYLTLKVPFAEMVEALKHV